MENKQFAYDVFLSYESHDRDVVAGLAEQLRSDGLKVWFDGWQTPGQNIQRVTEEALEES